MPKEILEGAGAEIKTASNSEPASRRTKGEKRFFSSTKKGTAIGADGGDTEVDFLVSEINLTEFDAVIFVGGPGCLKYLDNENSYKVAKEAVSQDKILASICISPVILAKAGILKGKKATVWSSPMDKSPVKILEENGTIYQNKPVVVDGKIITANGPAAVREFGQTIVEVLTKE
ncbi:MAG: DJ-1/PfpI family protein [Candidatus Nealsonbacteria bacterium]|nr:DJ-1/PfpI family protein [Candidatus Nealsonbacteria bacterium]